MNSITAMSMTKQQISNYPIRPDNKDIPVKDRDKVDNTSDNQIKSGQENSNGARPIEPRYDEYIHSGDTPDASMEENPVYSKPNKLSGNMEKVPESGKDEEEAPLPVKGKPDDKKADEEKCTVNTDKVDAEIKALKQELQRIKQQLNDASDDPDKENKLQQQLTSVEAELRMKDNDSYRKQHSTYTNH